MMAERIQMVQKSVEDLPANASKKLEGMEVEFLYIYGEDGKTFYCEPKEGETLYWNEGMREWIPVLLAPWSYWRPIDTWIALFSSKAMRRIVEFVSVIEKKRFLWADPKWVWTLEHFPEWIEPKCIDQLNMPYLGEYGAERFIKCIDTLNTLFILHMAEGYVAVRNTSSDGSHLSWSVETFHSLIKVAGEEWEVITEQEMYMLSWFWQYFLAEEVPVLSGVDDDQMSAAEAGV